MARQQVGRVHPCPPVIAGYHPLSDSLSHWDQWIFRCERLRNRGVHMYANQDAPIVPRNGHTLMVGIVARISGCANQKEMSLDDQVDHVKEVAAELYEGSIDYRIIATKGKGEALDRPELIEIEAVLRKGELDLLIFEDLGRLVRGGEATRLLGIGVDRKTRIIAPNDCIDTIEENWEQDALQACAEHVGHNAHTSKRLKFKLMNRFTKFGGATALPVYGYIVPPGAKTYDDWQKDPVASLMILEGARQLKQLQNCTAVADGFNAKNVSTGPYCRRKTWDGKMVRRFYSNTLLKGRPSRGTRRTEKRHENGRRVSVKNPSGPKFRDCPHLAHLDPMEFDELSALLINRNQHYKRKRIGGVDPRQVPRKRTRFPGQHSCCWYCGRQYIWGGNGINENLMCGGSREWLCWNSIGFNGASAAKQVLASIISELSKLEGIDSQFRQLVARAADHSDDSRTHRVEQLKKDEAALAIEKLNVQSVIAQAGAVPFVVEMMNEIKTKEQRLCKERQILTKSQHRELNLPHDTTELRQMLEEQCNKVAIDSPEFGQLMRELVPQFHGYLVRTCDGGHLLPRARVTLALDGILPDAQQVPGLPALLRREVTLDLFEPTQRERIREQSVLLAATGLRIKSIAEQIQEKPTSTAVQRALVLDRQMRSLSLTSPYVPVLQPPEDYPKLRRHRNSKYRFTPLDGYVPPAIE